MKQTKLVLKNVLGISHLELGGKSVELTGANGRGKSSVLDGIRKILTNDFGRDVIIRQGETEAELLIETNTGVKVERKIRTGKSDAFKVTENGNTVSSPQSFLNQIFTPLQLNPVAFTQMTRQEKNRIILDLIEFPWDINWIQEKFGEVPPGVDYSQNILQVLNDIQAERGTYYQARQMLNSKILHQRKSVSDIASVIPANYQADKWEAYDLGEKYKQLETIRTENGKIERAKLFAAGYDDKIRGFAAERDIAIAAEEKAIANERESLLTTIERLKAEIAAAENTLNTLDSKLNDKREIAESAYREKVAKLDGDNQIAKSYAGRQPVDTDELQAEISEAEAMKLHLNEYRRMRTMQTEVETMQAASEEYTRKIELARELPAEILKTATIPVKGLTVKDGIPLVNGLPIANLSTGEQLDLCIDVALSKPGNLEIILIDDVNNLDDENRARVYAKCKEKGLQIIASRTTNDNELMITEL